MEINSLEDDSLADARADELGLYAVKGEWVWPDTVVADSEQGVAAASMRWISVDQQV